MNLKTIYKSNGNSYDYWIQCLRRACMENEVSFDGNLKIFGMLFHQNWNVHAVLDLLRFPIKRAHITVEVTEANGNTYTQDFYSFDNIRTYFLDHPEVRMYFDQKGTFKA